MNNVYVLFVNPVVSEAHSLIEAQLTLVASAKRVSAAAMVNILYQLCTF